jgi:hypothetical protein
MFQKRVFILGSGFSKPAGLPLSTELTTEILDNTELRDLEEMQEWIESLKYRICGGNKTASINIEQLFDFAKYDEELWRMKQQLCPVSRNHGDTPYQKADAIDTWLGYMEEELPLVIWNKQKTASIDYVKRFIDSLTLEDTVITFNYDTLIESVLSEQNKKWNHGLNDSNNGGISVLKMHGSIDWFVFKRGRTDIETDTWTKLFSKTDVNVKNGTSLPVNEPEFAWELWRPNDKSLPGKILDGNSNPFQNQISGLAGLGSYKPLNKLPGSAKTWVNAFKALNEANEVYVIGFSMSPYDSMTRFHFKSVIRERKKPLEKIVVIDPNVAELISIFESIFNNSIISIAKSVKDINWDELFKT